MKAILERFWSGWQQHGLTQRAAALAYSALFAMAPLFLLLLVAATAILGKASADGELYARLSDIAGASAANEALRVAHGASHAASVWSAIIGGCVAIVAGLGMTLQFESAVDAIWEEPSRATGIWMQVRQRLIAAIALIVIVIGFLVLAFLDTALGKFALHDAALVHGLAWLAVGICVWAFFTIVYRTVPQERPHWKGALVAGIVTTGLVLAGQAGFAVYLHFVHVGSAYGDAGSLIVLLVWLYYSSLAALTGAELARSIETAARVPGAS